MNKIALMFPGQGSQYIGMGKDIYESSLAAKEIFLKADQILGFSLTQMMFEGTSEDLAQTQNTQPAILTVSIALLEALKESLAPQSLLINSVIGHSLGEYSAYVASRRLDFKEALSLVRQRGLFMKKVSSPLYGMAAVLKIQTPHLQEILKEHANNEVFIANDNCPGQLVISGLKEKIQAMTPLLLQKGAKVIMLPVSGAFHSPYMQGAKEELIKELHLKSFTPSFIPLYANIDAMLLKEGEEKESLTSQITSGVLFTTSIQNMVKEQGITLCLEVGPGKVLQGLVKKIDSSILTLGIQDQNDIKTIKEVLK